MLRIWSGAKVKCREDITGRAAFAKVCAVSDTTVAMEYLQSERRTLNGTQFKLTAFNQQFLVENPAQVLDIQGRRFTARPLGAPIAHRLALPLATCGIHAPFQLDNGKSRRSLAVVGIAHNGLAFDLDEPISEKTAFRILLSFDTAEVEFDAVSLQQITTSFGCYCICLVANQNRLATGIWSTLQHAA